MTRRRLALIAASLLAALAVLLTLQPDARQRASLAGLFPLAGAVTKLDEGDQPLIRSAPAGPWDGVNDGRHHGFAAFGIHVARKPTLEPFFGNARHLDSVHWADAAGRDGYGVAAETRTVTERGTVTSQTLVAAWQPVAVVVTRRVLRDRRLTVFADVTFLPAIEGWYVKEAKWAAGPFVGRLKTVTTRDAAGVLLGRHELGDYSDPRKHTRQLIHERRRQAEPEFGDHRVRLFASGLAEGSYHGANWHNGPGLDEVRRLLQPAPKYSSSTSPAYCHAERLRPTWEVVVWPDRTTLLLNAGTGGVGFHDCLPTYRFGGPLAGRTFRTLLRLEW